MSLVLVLVLIAMGLTVAEAMGKVPGWPAKFVICVALLCMVWRH